MSGAVKRGRGRPAVGPEVHVRLPAPLLAELDEQAEADGVTRAVVIRRLLEQAIRR